MAILSGQKKRRESVSIGGVDIGVGVGEEEIGDGGATSVRRKMKSRPSAEVRLEGYGR